MSVIVSNYTDNGYSFDTNSDGMMLVSRIKSDTTLSGSGNNSLYPWTTSTSTSTGASIPSTLAKTVTVSSQDIYLNQTLGVYIINLGGLMYPVISSSAYFSNINIPANSENGVLVFPGWGFRLFSSPGGSGYATTSTFSNYSSWDAQSYTYFNDTTEVAFFTSAEGWGSNKKNYAPSGQSANLSLPSGAVTIPIMTQMGTNMVNRSFPDDCCDGIKIFYRSGTHYTIPGFPA